MVQSGRGRWRQRRFSLSLRLSLLLLLAALVPLVITVTSDDLLARSRLIDQGTQALQTDVQNKADLVNTYLHERRLDAETLANIETTTIFFEDVATGEMNAVDTQRAAIALGAGQFRDKNYASWSYVDTQGQVRLSTDQNEMAPGAVKIPTPELDAILHGREYLSPIFYDPATRQGLMHIAVPSATKTGQIIGYIRATLRITHIWDIVANDEGANGSGSGAFILDENGVRIADTNAAERFTAVASLSDDVQNEIKTEARYGSTAPVPVQPLPQVANALDPAAPNLFQAPAVAGDSTTYQFAKEKLTEVPWTYFVLSPLPTVTSVADTQIKISALIAAIVATIAAIIGLWLGRSTARPVLTSVTELRSTTTSLNTLGAQEESAASEQLWMVDACRSGVEQISYLANATNVAAGHMIQAGRTLEEQWEDLPPEEVMKAAALLVRLSLYIEEASRQQLESTGRLTTALKVTNQVADQLAASAEAAGQYANQLERVVAQLQRLVGARQEPEPEENKAQAGAR